MLSHSYNILIDRGAESPRNDKYVVNVLNATDKNILATLITTVQLPASFTNE